MDLHSQHDLQSSFLNIQETDLPFGNQHNSWMRFRHLNMSSEKEAIPFRVGRASKFSEEGAQLLANLTGVKDLFHPKDDGVETACCELEPTPANNRGNPHQKQRVKNSTAIQSRNMAYLSGLQEEDTAIVSVSERSQMNQHSEKNKDSINCVRMMDKSIDTGDLSFWTYVVPQHELRSSDEESENSFTLESHENPAANEAFIEGTVRVQGGDFDKDHSMGYGEYITRVKESMAFIQMRTQMLHELSLGEDPKRNNAKSLITTGKFIVEDKRKKEPDISSSISSASIAVKQARQLVGLIHSEEQAIKLQNIFTQLQYLGKLSSNNGSYDAHVKRSSTIVGAIGTMERRPTNGIDSKIGYSIFECLQQAHEGVQLILASIYNGKNNVLSRQAELIFNDKSESGNLDYQEHNLQKYLERLLILEDNYELIGAAISNSLDEAEKLEDDYQALQQELVANGCPPLTVKSGSSKYRKKRGSKYVNKEYIGEISGDESKDGGYESDSKKGDEQGESSNETINKTKKGRKQSKIKGRKEQIDVDAPIHTNQLHDDQVAPTIRRLNRSQSVAVFTGDASQKSIFSVPYVVSEKDVHHSNSSMHQSFGNETSEFRALLNNKLQSAGEEERLTPLEEDSSVGEVDLEPRSYGALFNTSYGKSKIERNGRSSISVLEHRSVQTEDVAILSLDDREVTTITNGEIEIENLHTEIMKLKKQLQFWRAKNWAENHHMQPRTDSAPIYAFINDPAADALIFYYDVQTGQNSMINIAELDPQMQNSILKLATKPVQVAKVLPLPEEKIAPTVSAIPSSASQSFCLGASIRESSAKLRAKSMAAV